MTIRNASSKVYRLQRAGGYGFVSKKGCLNVSVSRAKFSQVVVGDSAATHPAKPVASATDGETIDDVEDEVVEDEADAEIAEIAEIAENVSLLQKRMYIRTKLTVPFHRFLRKVQKGNK